MWMRNIYGIFLFILILIRIELNAIPLQKSKLSKNEIYFPEEGVNVNLNDVLNCAKGNTFCEDFNSYPMDYLKQILHMSQFGTEGVFKNLKSELSDRYFNDEENICSSRRRILFPKAARNERHQWKIIVNFEKYTQGVTVQICMKEGACNMFSDGGPIGFMTKCKQEYSYVQLLSEQDGKLVFDYFMFPTACSCVLKRNYHFLYKRET